MKNGLLMSALAFVVFIGFSFVFSSHIFILLDHEGYEAATFFIDSTSTEAIKQKYTEAPRVNQKVKILIAPGHEEKMGGTEFRGIREAVMNVALGEALKEFLEKDPNIEAILVRDRNGYNPIFENYFKQEWEGIKTFMSRQKLDMQTLVEAGQIDKVEGVLHNKAPADHAVKLYGINKWANENKVDLTISIHFNDYPRRKLSREGVYSGFAIYAPEKQFSNAKASHDFARAVQHELLTFYEKSDLPKEEEGIISDQELIAIGAFNTLDAAGLLIEYGYIYEPQFLNPVIREASLKELALKTYQGIVRYLGGTPEFASYGTLALPYVWNKELKKGDTDKDIFSLQVALLKEGVYPPAGKTKKECPLSGVFGNCTITALSKFQDKYMIEGEEGLLGSKTRGKLNELFAR